MGAINGAVLLYFVAIAVALRVATRSRAARRGPRPLAIPCSLVGCVNGAYVLDSTGAPVCWDHR